MSRLEQSLALLFATSWLWLGCGTIRRLVQEHPIQLSGTVVDEKNDRPVRGAVVRLVEVDREGKPIKAVDSVETPESGRFYFTLPTFDRSKRYKVVAEKWPLAHESGVNIQYEKGALAPLQIRLIIAAGLEGTVVSTRADRPDIDRVAVPGARVVLLKDTKDTKDTTKVTIPAQQTTKIDTIGDQQTTKEGYFSFSSEPAGSYIVKISKIYHYNTRLTVPQLRYGMIATIICPIQYIGREYIPLPGKEEEEEKDISKFVIETVVYND